MGRYGMARPFSPASDMMPVSEKEEERTDDYRDPWCRSGQELLQRRGS